MRPGEGPAASLGASRTGRELRPLMSPLQEPGNALYREARRRRCAPLPLVWSEAVACIGPKTLAPLADSLLTDPSRALPAANQAPDFPHETETLRSEPRGDRTHDPRLKRPVLYQLS